MSRLYAHLLPLAAASLASSLELITDFAVVAGRTEDGKLTLPLNDEQEYVVAGGFDGLPYHGDLGTLGGRIDVRFAVPVTALIVATASEARPVPQLLTAGGLVPAVLALPLFASIAAIEVGGSPQDHSNDNWYLAQPDWSNQQGPADQRPAHIYLTKSLDDAGLAQSDVIGKTWAQLVALGWTTTDNTFGEAHRRYAGSGF